MKPNDPEILGQESAFIILKNQIIIGQQDDLLWDIMVESGHIFAVLTIIWLAPVFGYTQIAPYHEPSTSLISKGFNNPDENRLFVI